MSAIFRFEAACVVAKPDVRVTFVGGKEMPCADVLLEVKLPANRNGVCQKSIVPVEVWGDRVKLVEKLQPGQLVSAGGVVQGRPWVDRSGRQRYSVVLRLRELRVQSIATGYKQGEMGYDDDEDIGF
ncbi:MAG: single-stranded DNA-binding protein [Akkermansia sp.]|nr:single-stranded DNA-binding protein [Akkermansia sp.]